MTLIIKGNIIQNNGGDAIRIRGDVNTIIKDTYKGGSAIKRSSAKYLTLDKVMDLMGKVVGWAGKLLVFIKTVITLFFL